MEHPPQPDITAIASMIGQPTRAEMLSALLGGKWLTAAELARCAGVAPSTASQHLAGLVEVGLVSRRKSGRRRYHALSGPEVAAALEALLRLQVDRGSGQQRVSESERALRFARTCYDHLAGNLGVLVADALVARGIVSPTGSEVTSAGEAWLRSLDMDVAGLRAVPRTFVRFCLDWSERRDHVAGAVGAAVTATMLARRWIVRMEGTRAVRLTLRGREGLYRALDLEVELVD